MKQLSGLDASFLSMETPTTFGHVNGLGIYERPSGDFDPYPAVRERMAAIVGHLEPMRRRLVEVPFGLDHPYWIDDPHFDLDFHVRHLGLAPPGTMEQLGEQVARIIGRPMDRAHPLWEMYVIEGLADGRWAVLTKTHHATVDGAAGVLLLTMLTDDRADAPLPEAVVWEPEPVPSDAAMLKRTAIQLAKNPVKAARLQLRLVRDLAHSAGIDSVAGLAGRTRDAITAVARAAQSGDDDERHLLPAAVTQAPPTPWNHTITAHRRFALRSASLSDIKAVKDAAGCTVNDVVMAMCAGALRAYLLDHDALPDEPLRALVPVSIRTGAEADPWTNRVSAILAEVPTHVADPMERLQACHDAMVDAKHQLDVVPEDAIGELAETLTPLVTSSAMRLVSRLKLADRIHLPANLTISNVPGPRSPLYFAGARLENYIPVSIVTDGLGLNITVHSYVDALDIGIVAARELVPDVEHMADLHLAELATLREATGA
jgi:WS/DGAT/MGAT family acyltransferase